MIEFIELYSCRNAQTVTALDTGLRVKPAMTD